MLKIGQQRYYDKLHKTDGAPVSTVELFQSLIASGETSEAALHSILGALTQEDTLEVVLHNNAVTVGEGSRFVVGNYRSLRVAISGDALTRTVQFKGIMGGIPYAMAGIRMSDLEPESGTENNNEVWIFDITGLDGVEAHITAIDGGTVSIRGKAVR
jgi:hypothetical protein